VYKDNKLKNKVSNFQTKVSKRPFESTANYENSMRPNRMDPRIFSVYKILDPLRGYTIDEIFYVDDGYVEDDYIVSYDEFNPPGNPL
jgi:hypothetical protein